MGKSGATAEENGYMENLKYEILKVLVFYDIFKFPLTPLEVHKNLGVAVDFATTVHVLDELKNENPGSRAELPEGQQVAYGAGTTGHGKIIEESGYLSLRAGLAEERKARFLISFKKLERAKKVVRIFAWFPFVKFVGVCNSLGFFNSADGSDIDFFVVARRGRLWTVRFFTNLFLKIFNLRPTRESNKDKICLSFFVGDDGLDISEVALAGPVRGDNADVSNGAGGDPYFNYWMTWLLPLYDDKIYKKFFEANAWIKNCLPNFIAQDNYFAPRRRPVKRIFERIIAGRLEQKLKNFQLKVMPAELKDAVNRGDKSVVISDQMLKFHLLDRRAEYREKYDRAVSRIMY